ncbi:hypothetical protein [Falsiroseomonas oryzae]|uniref:hypothetical protein n=1 Tax=Falsiroseomonas oryzae TaxID=2766473 RepID=UPI0022EB7859|nr:hypothetical protein [Roseomonas sp. MO-31]
MSPIRAPRARGKLAAFALAALLAAGPAAAQQGQPPAQQLPNREVTVQNETDLTLRELYLAAPNATDRGPDRLGADMVAPGALYRVRLGRTRDCVFNVTAVFLDGSEEQRQRVDICRAPRLVFGDPAMPTLEVAVANRSRVTLRELYALPAAPPGDAAARNWGPDRLGTSMVEAGGSFAMRLRTRDCRFDLRGVYVDEREEVLRNLDLCATRSVAFDRSTVPDRPTRSILLANRHLATVQQVYLSPSTETDWGPDRLGAATLEPGEDIAVEMQGGCEADLRIVFPNGGAEERRAVNVCESTRIVLRPGWVLAERLDEEGAVPGQMTEPEPDPGALRLRNAGRLPIVEIYTGPPGGPRGEDRLGADTLPVGAVIEIEPEDPDSCAADLVVVFRDGREVVRPGVDLCAGEEMDVR